jgi:hypothetical protein
MGEDLLLALFPGRVEIDRAFGGEAVDVLHQLLEARVNAPKANAIAERLVGTLRRECLDHLIFVNERHLLRLLREYVAHYNDARPHRALGLEPPAGTVQLALVLGAGSSPARCWAVCFTNTKGRLRDRGTPAD